MSFLAVRPALPQDEGFLWDLYYAVRAPEFAPVAMPAAQKMELIRMQFRGQMASYAAQFPNSCYHIVLLDGQSIGRLWVARNDTEYTLVDVAILPELRNKGIGSALVGRLQQEAQQAKLPIASTVFRFNPGSLRFHQRHGFQIVREDIMYYYMQWVPPPLL